jgi:cobalt/nickel transport system ATP-binding protein
MDVMKLQDVSYRYPESPFALEDISLSIAKGERVSLVGPNGAGKSTLLHLMAGLYYPTKGMLEVEGTLLTKKEARSVRQKVGFLFQDPDDQIFMPTVREDVAFGPINLSIPKQEVERRVEEAMKLTAIEDYRDRAPHHLSLGEKKRVAMAGLLAMSPNILLLDEPTSNLDPQSRRELVNILEGRKETMVIATHDMSAAFHLAHRVVVLKNTVLYDGDIPGLLRDPEILQEARLELPSFSRLMQSWASETGKSFEPPLTVNAALGVLRNNYCCRGSGEGKHSH